MGEASGVLAALLSSALGGTAIVATRYAAAEVSPLMLGFLRFGIGFAILLPAVIIRRERWPAPKDWPGAIALGLLFFGLFPVLFNLSLVYTTAGRAGLALATLPLLTMVAGAAFGVERLTVRKTIGVLIATGGVGLALLSSLSAAPQGAWRGDLLMVAGALCMALYSVWSRPYIDRSGTLSFAAAGMAIGVVSLGLVLVPRHGFDGLSTLITGPEALAVLYLGVIGGALVFFLWSFALAHTTPTRVAVSITVNPVIAGLFGALILGEPIGWTLLAGLAAVTLGIAIATSRGGQPA
ncbi:DMT family transporter [Chelatococcus sp. GCM10030263]|uniref:DMT family transporter n=1 Tax=Chelatococcus sp. GCM10030263 TaxID=3273387 RepID=UPI00361264E7